MECKKSDRLTVAKLNTISKPYKQDYKSKLMMEKYSLLPINPQQLTPAQTALQRMSEKIWILRYKLLTPSDPQILNIQRNPNYWYQLIPHYWSLEMRDTWIGITNPGTRSSKSLLNINAFLRHLSLHNRWKITIWQ